MLRGLEGSGVASGSASGFRSARAAASAAEDADDGDAEELASDGAELARERHQMRQFTRELNADEHRQFCERTGGPDVPHRSMGQDASAVPDGNGDGSSDDGDDNEQDDEEDVAVRSIGPAVAPSDFTIDTDPPGSAAEDLIGRHVLFEWDGAPLRLSKCDWYVAVVELIATDIQKDNDPGVTHQCLFKNAKNERQAPVPFRLAAGGRRVTDPARSHPGIVGGGCCLWLVAYGWRGASITATVTCTQLRATAAHMRRRLSECLCVSCVLGVVM